jgi:AAA ATPase domain
VTYDWKALTPHKPIGLDARLYVEPPTSGAQEIAHRIRAGAGAILVGGPAGVGKSTELARAAALLDTDCIPCLSPLSLFENMRKLDASQLAIRLFDFLHIAAQKRNVELSEDVTRLAHATYSVVGERRVADGVGFEATATDALRQLVLEIGRLTGRRIVFLIDGLEKIVDVQQSLDLFGELSALPNQASIVAVIPWHATFGMRGDALIRPGEWFLPLRALDAGNQGREFLLAILARRLQAGAEPAIADWGALGLPESARKIALNAVGWSGGIPRTFLQVMADAGTYSLLRGHEGWPEEQDLENAVADLQDSFRRLLQPGDTAAIRAAAGTDGRELELPRKVRLMAHGILLERVRDRRPFLEIHPLARRSIDEVAADA